MHVICVNQFYFSNFSNEGPAMAYRVKRLGVSGVTKVEKGHKYQVSFQVSMREHAFGWEDTPVRVSAKVGAKGEFHYREVDVSGLPKTPLTIPSEDQTLEIEVPPDSNDDEIHFGLYENSMKDCKDGLLIHSAIVVAVDEI